MEAQLLPNLNPNSSGLSLTLETCSRPCQRRLSEAPFLGQLPRVDQFFPPTRIPLQLNISYKLDLPSTLRYPTHHYSVDISIHFYLTEIPPPKFSFDAILHLTPFNFLG